MSIDELKAGPETDALIAEKVMGWKLGAPKWIHGPMMHGMVEVQEWKGSLKDGRWHSKESWTPSTTIACAWEVVENMKSRGLTPEIDLREAGWACCFADYAHTPVPHQTTCIADTAPLAICKASLKIQEEPET